MKQAFRAHAKTTYGVDVLVCGAPGEADHQVMKIGEELGAVVDASRRVRVVLWGPDSDLLLHSHIPSSMLVRSVNWRKDTCVCVSLEELLQSPASLFFGFCPLDVRTDACLVHTTLLPMVLLSHGPFLCLPALYMLRFASTGQLCCYACWIRHGDFQDPSRRTSACDCRTSALQGEVRAGGVAKA